MANKVHISNATQNQPGQVTTLLTAALTEGVHDKSRGDYAVTGTAGLAVTVAAGEAFIGNDSYVAGTMDQKFYSVASSGTTSVVINSNSSGNPRIDTVCLAVDTGVSPGAQGVNALSIVAVQGTASAVPAQPTIPNNYLVLADIAVANGASAISDANITDRRKQAIVGMVAGPEGFLVNGKLSVGTSSGTLIVELVNLNGEAPDEFNPCWVTVGGELRSVETATNVSIPSGTNTFESGGSSYGNFSRPYFVYGCWNTTPTTPRVDVIVSPVAKARIYSDFSSTNTNRKYGAYSGVNQPQNSDICTPIGYFEARLAPTTFVWSNVNYVTSTPTRKSRTKHTWLPSMSGFSSAPTGSSNYYAYSIDDSIVSVTNQQGDNGISNLVSLSIELPFTALVQASPAYVEQQALGFARNNGASPTATNNYVQIASGANFLQAALYDSTNGWLNSGGKRIRHSDFDYVMD